MKQGRKQGWKQAGNKDGSKDGSKEANFLEGEPFTGAFWNKKTQDPRALIQDKKHMEQRQNQYSMHMSRRPWAIRCLLAFIPGVFVPDCQNPAPLQSKAAGFVPELWIGRLSHKPLNKIKQGQ